VNELPRAGDDPAGWALFRRIAMRCPIPVFTTDEIGRHLFVNPRWCELTGIDAAEALGWGWERAVHPGDLRTVTDRWSRLVPGDDGVWVRLRLVRPDGLRRAAILQAVPTTTGDGSRRYVGTLTALPPLPSWPSLLDPALGAPLGSLGPAEPLGFGALGPFGPGSPRAPLGPGGPAGTAGPVDEDARPGGPSGLTVPRPRTGREQPATEPTAGGPGADGLGTADVGPNDPTGGGLGADDVGVPTDPTGSDSAGTRGNRAGGAAASAGGPGSEDHRGDGQLGAGRPHPAQPGAAHPGPRRAPRERAGREYFYWDRSGRRLAAPDGGDGWPGAAGPEGPGRPPLGGEWRAVVALHGRGGEHPAGSPATGWWDAAAVATGARGSGGVDHSAGWHDHDAANGDRPVGPARDASDGRVAGRPGDGHAHSCGCLYGELIRAEGACRDRERWLTSLLAELPAAVLLADPNGRVVGVNQAYCDLFDLAEAPVDLVGTDCRLLLRPASGLVEDPAGFASRLDTLLRRRRTTRQEPVMFSDGRVFERSHLPLTGADGYRGHLWLYLDVTDRRILEAEVEGLISEL
jgi:PAS domain S-box-containing protein